jgi:hypothetical protein
MWGGGEEDVLSWSSPSLGYVSGGEIPVRGWRA